MNKYDSLIINDDYKKYLDSVQQVIEKDNLGEKGIDITDAPLSPMLMDSTDMPVLLMPQVVDEYRSIVNKINDENKETALEYAYILLGKRGRLDNEEICAVYRVLDCNEETLDNKSVKFNVDKLTEALRIMQEQGYNYISLAHTHPKVKSDVEAGLLSNYLSEEVKSNELIRETGLNISLQDIINYEKSIFEHFKDNHFVTTCSTVIMHNGELAMFGIQSGKLVRYVNLVDVQTAENLYVSNKDEYLEQKMSA